MLGLTIRLLQDLWTTVSVPANVEMEMLRRMSLQKLRPAWDRWSHCYPINESDATVYATVSRGTKEVSGDNCILDFFLKKSRGSSAVANYDFSLVLELQLGLSKSFCQAAAEHCLDEENGLQV